MRKRQLGMSPAKIAIAVAVTIEAIAGTGGMKNVTGTRSAVAIVAVRPGTAPTKRPNNAEARITQRTYGSKTSAVPVTASLIFTRYFARPTALSVAPMLASESAMNFVVP